MTLPTAQEDPGAGADDTSVAGVRVLVTGGTSGLGRAMAAALAGAGARVVLTGRDADRAAGAAAELSAALAGSAPAGEVHGLGVDVRDEASVEAGVARALELLGGLDVLVNNAGIGMRTVDPGFLSEPRGFWEVSPDGFRDVVETNLTGYFLVARAVVPHFLAAGRGRILNVTMNRSTMTRRGFVPYGPSRAGAEALSRIMAADLADHGVAVNLLLPGGATQSGMIPDGVPEEVRAALLPAEVMAAPVLWLCSPAADGVTDQRVVATEFHAWREQQRDRAR